MNVNEECFEQMILWALENPYSPVPCQKQMVAAAIENWALLSESTKDKIVMKIRSTRYTDVQDAWGVLVERRQEEQLSNLKPVEVSPKLFMLHSRAAVPRMVSLVDPAKGVFLVVGSSSYYRAGEGMYDFEGGPMLQVGEEFYGWGTIRALKPVRKDDLEITPKIRNGLNGGPKEFAVLVSVDYSEDGLLKIEDFTLTSAPDGAL